MTKKVMYYTQEVLFETYIPYGGWAKGRNYFMMKDVDGTHYLAPVGEDGNPDLS